MPCFIIPRRAVRRQVLAALSRLKYVDFQDVIGKIGGIEGGIEGRRSEKWTPKRERTSLLHLHHMRILFRHDYHHDLHTTSVRVPHLLARKLVGRSNPYQPTSSNVGSPKTIILSQPQFYRDTFALAGAYTSWTAA
ncbi:uncharacterized protein PV06_08438 [Exophiala oligosperma]|uniref:Uncharacterized protein n=1 Tax=Exophiala oligosperma TaxID=215243 RepID=A0A0D2DBL1_9EURO|nr:uncharacterized protein PV06_08438 [Exophiala oligosperma]KIW39865.1 hypothetical protein PV06_08438 [Exophiala oligosperma]